MVRVLLIDDHKLMLEGLSMLLNEEPDLEVVATGYGSADAVELVADHQPDVVLMDVMMDDMNGIEATRVLKRHWPNLRVIGLSMSNSEQTEARMREAGAEAYLTKGIPSADLIAAIRGHLATTT